MVTATASLLHKEALVRPKSLRDLAASHLRSAIIDAEVEFGAMLSENALAEEMGISKTPIHEALVILQGEGLVDILPQRGARVFQPTPAMLADLGDYRLLLENRAISLAYERARKAFVATADDLLQKMIAAWDSSTKDYLRLDTAFHDVSFQLCDSPCLQKGATQIASQVAAIRTHLAGRDHTSRRMAFEEHKKIVRLLQKGHLNEIPPILKAHVNRLSDLLVVQTRRKRAGADS